jgi:hypothetical protein
LDVIPSGLDNKIPLLVQEQLDKDELFLFTDQVGRGLGTRRTRKLGQWNWVFLVRVFQICACRLLDQPRKEGELVCNCPAILFTDVQKVMAFLKIPGNSTLGGSIVSMENVPYNGQTGPLFAVLVGAARYVTHYAGRSAHSDQTFTYLFCLARGFI